MGSGYLRTLQPPKVLMLIGAGIASTEAGEVWHLLDQRLSMPITKMDIMNVGRADLGRYNTIVLVSGNYDKALADRIKPWVQNGGTLITIKSASDWAIKQGLTKEKLLVIDTPKNTIRMDYDDAIETEGAKALGGSIFQADLDTTNPVGFGFGQRKIAVYKNSQTYLLPSTNPYSTIAKYTDNPLIGGYLHPTAVDKIKKSAVNTCRQ